MRGFPPPLPLLMMLLAALCGRLSGEGRGAAVACSARRPSIVLALRGGGPAKARPRATGPEAAAPAAGADNVHPDDALAGTMPYYAPGDLPDWAQAIAEWRNMTMAEKVAKAEATYGMCVSACESTCATPR